MTTAADLKQRNLFYRRPDLYDQARGPADDELTKLLRALTADYAPHARTLLDLGCGTGRDIESLAEEFDCVGVDLQPQMIAYAQQVRAAVDLREGDMRTVRLGQSFDIITCLGSALAYLPDNADLTAAFETFAAHAHPGTLLVICTQLAPIQPDGDHPALQVDAGGLQATRTTSFEWDLATQINTMHRCWHMDNGSEHHDTIAWRVTGPKELELYATSAGFHPVETFTCSTTRAQPLEGAVTGWLVAVYDTTSI